MDGVWICSQYEFLEISTTTVNHLEPFGGENVFQELVFPDEVFVFLDYFSDVRSPGVVLGEET